MKSDVKNPRKMRVAVTVRQPWPEKAPAGRSGSRGRRGGNGLKISKVTEMSLSANQEKAEMEKKILVWPRWRKRYWYGRDGEKDIDVERICLRRAVRSALEKEEEGEAGREGSSVAATTVDCWLDLNLLDRDELPWERLACGCGVGLRGQSCKIWPGPRL
ncbi:hypothetical protein F0562_003648 [Nyssa sinensis]|uniref:Uncharacterized protein n=1 Tax=Nyssa sinensis TaxID=561372 RepID=A0A5J5BX77_9ASTE|nr:hypothetical protein F0562_003648 [Nyssa sinensis]